MGKKRHVDINAEDDNYVPLVVGNVYRFHIRSGGTTGHLEVTPRGNGSLLIRGMDDRGTGALVVEPEVSNVVVVGLKGVIR